MEEFKALGAGVRNGKSLGCAGCPLTSRNSELFFEETI